MVQAGIHVKRQHGVGDAVGQYGFLEQANGEQGGADGHIRPGEAVRGAGELRHHFAVMHDGAGDQMGEENHEQPEIPQPEFRHVAAADIHQQGDLLEGVEADAEGEQDCGDEKMRAREHVDRVDEVISVFVVGQQADIHHHGQGEQPAAAAWRRVQHDAGDQVVEQNAGEQQRQIPQIPTGVEIERGCDQPELSGARPGEPRQRVTRGQCERQEGENEFVGVKEHVATVL